MHWGRAFWKVRELLPVSPSQHWESFTSVGPGRDHNQGSVNPLLSPRDITASAPTMDIYYLSRAGRESR